MHFEEEVEKETNYSNHVAINHAVGDVVFGTNNSLFNISRFSLTKSIFPEIKLPSFPVLIVRISRIAVPKKIHM